MFELRGKVRKFLQNNPTATAQYIGNKFKIPFRVAESLLKELHKENTGATSQSIVQPKRSRFLGVVWDSQKHMWRAEFKQKGRIIVIGHFHDEKDAGNFFFFFFLHLLCFLIFFVSKIIL